MYTCTVYRRTETGARRQADEQRADILYHAPMWPALRGALRVLASLVPRDLNSSGLSQLKRVSLSCGHLPLVCLPCGEREDQLLVHCDNVVRGVGREGVLYARGDGEPMRLGRVQKDCEDTARFRVGVKCRLETLHLRKGCRL